MGNIVFDNSTADLIVDTYSKINNLKLASTSEEYMEFIEYMNAYSVMSNKLTNVISKESRKIFKHELSELIDLTKRLIECDKDNFLINYIYPTISAHLKEIEKNLQLIKTNINS